MSSTTGEHIDELQARRKRRERRQPTADPAAKPQTGAAARDLLRDLLTGGPGADDRPRTPDSAYEPDPAADDKAQTATVSAAQLNPTEPTRRDAEGVDEFVRRVKAGTEAITAAASRTSSGRRPMGTADLSADAVARHRPKRGALGTTHRARAWRPAWRGRRARMVALPCGLVTSVAIVIVLSNGGNHLVGTHRAAAAPPTVHAPWLSPLIAIPNTIRAVVARLEATTAHRTGASKRAHRTTKHPRARTRHAVQPAGAAPAGQSAPTSYTSSSGASSSGSGYTPPSTASTSQSSSTGASPSSRSGQSAGPTNAGPLGGIGSCVKGC